MGLVAAEDWWVEFSALDDSLVELQGSGSPPVAVRPPLLLVPAVVHQQLQLNTSDSSEGWLDTVHILQAFQGFDFLVLPKSDFCYHPSTFEFAQW